MQEVLKASNILNSSYQSRIRKHCQQSRILFTVLLIMGVKLVNADLTRAFIMT